MERKEFSVKTRRQALERSQGHCEASGPIYGLPSGKRCCAPLSAGVDFDHFPVRAADGGDNSLANVITHPFGRPRFDRSGRVQARVARMTSKGFAPFSRAVSIVVRTSASAFAAHMAR